MKKFRLIFAVCLLGISVILSGCGSFPDLTDDEYREVVNYAAGLVTRYSRGTADKLTNVSVDYEPEGLVLEDYTVPEEEEPAAEPVQPEAAETPVSPSADISGNDAQPAPEPPDQVSETPDPSESAEEPVETIDTAGGDEQAQSGGRTYEAAGEAALDTPLTPMSESWLQSLADGIRVEYTGYSIRSAYPDAESQGAVYAGAGERLLVLDFRLRNTTSGEASINTARYGPAYKVVINGYVQGFTLVTMIDNDLSSMIATLAPGEKRDVVLVMQLPADVAKTVDKLDLRILQGTEMQTINLE